MPRPPCCRRIAAMPRCGLFRPAGPCGSMHQEVLLTVDELEALRLADLQALYHEQAAERMHVSRQTFGRIVESARKKVAQSLIEGKPLRIEGGPIEMAATRRFLCSHCQHAWEVPHGDARPRKCPKCGDANIHRHPDDRGGWGWRGGRGGGRGRGRGRCLRAGHAVRPPADEETPPQA